MNIYEIIAVASAALALGAGAWDALRLHRRQRYSVWGLLIGAAGPVLSLVLYLQVTEIALKQIAAVGLVVGGGALGVYVARLAALSETDVAGEVRLVGASWLPVPAACCVAALQFSAAGHSLAGIVISLAALEAAVGFGVAAAATIVYRRMTLGQTGASSVTAIPVAEGAQAGHSSAAAAPSVFSVAPPIAAAVAASPKPVPRRKAAAPKKPAAAPKKPATPAKPTAAPKKAAASTKSASPRPRGEASDS